MDGPSDALDFLKEPPNRTSARKDFGMAVIYRISVWRQSCSRHTFRSSSERDDFGFSGVRAGQDEARKDGILVGRQLEFEGSVLFEYEES